MGNSQTKNEMENSLVVIRNPKLISSIKQYNKFKTDNKYKVLQYNSFDQFIEKQSLKNLHYILIIQNHKSEEQNKKQIQSINGNKNNSNDYQQQIYSIKRSIPQYLHKIQRKINQNNIDSNQQVIQSNDRQKLINYIRKYSLSDLNVYIYNQKLQLTVLPQEQHDYITLMSNNFKIIKNHIENQKKQTMTMMKFKRLLKDISKRQLVILLSKYYKIKQTRIEGQELIYNIYSVEKQLKRRTLPYQALNTIQELKQKLNKFYPEFVICTEFQELLPLIQLKKVLYADFKIIYFGNNDAMISNQKKFKHQQKYSNQLKKKQQTWWLPKNVKQIGTVLENWNYNRKNVQDKQLYSTNTVIYFKRTQNILKIDKIAQKIEQSLQQMYLNDFELKNNSSIADKSRYESNKQQKSNYKSNNKNEKKSKKNKKNKKQIIQNLNIHYENNILGILQRINQSLFTVLIMFDATVQQVDRMKQVIFLQNNYSSRVKIVPIDGAHLLNKQQMYLKSQRSIVKQNSIKSLKTKQLKVRIQNTCKLNNYQLRFEQLPLDTINVINLQKSYNYFENKMGLKLNKIKSQQIHEYFPKIKKIKKDKLMQKQQQQQQKLVYQKVFEHYYIICNLQDYYNYLFPYLNLLNFYKYDEIQNGFTLKIKNQWMEQIKNYIKQIKIIIFDQLNINNKQIDQFSINKSHIEQISKKHHQHNLKIYQYEGKLKQFYQIHQTQSDYKNKIKSIIRKFIIENNSYQYKKYQQAYKIQEKQLNDQSNKFNQIKNQSNLLMKFSLKIKRNSTMIQRSDVFFTLYQKIFKNLITSDIQMNKNKPFKFPNIIFVHFRLSEIQQFLQFCKCQKISQFSEYKQISMNNFYQAKNKIQNILQPNSIELNATFISKNQLIQQYFQEKNVNVISNYLIQLAKFQQHNQSNDKSKFQKYIKRFAQLWKLKLKLSTQSNQANQKHIKQLKKDIQRAFYKCKSYDLLKISSNQFQHFYINKIQECKTLFDLKIAAIYIYSLPHGLQEIISIIFTKPLKSAIAIEIFSSFILVLFLNFYSFQITSICQDELVIYIQDEYMSTFYDKIKQTQIIYNKNIFHCLSNDDKLQNSKNNCIFIKYVTNPLSEKSNINIVVNIENIAFYKESAQFIIAPYSRFRLIKKQKINDKYNLWFQIIEQPNNPINIFLQQFFKLNQINQIQLMKQLNRNIRVQDKQKDHKNNKNNYKKINQHIKSNHNININNQKNNNKISLYRQAQLVSLTDQKHKISNLMNIGLKHSLFVQNINNNKKYLTARAELQSMRLILLNLLLQKKIKQFQAQSINIQFNKLNIQQAYLYSKMSMYSKSIQCLTNLYYYIKYNKNQINIQMQQNHLNKAPSILYNKSLQIQLRKEIQREVKKYLKNHNDMKFNTGINNISKDKSDDRDQQQKIKDHWLLNKIIHTISEYEKLQKQRKKIINNIQPKIQWNIQMVNDYQYFQQQQNQEDNTLNENQLKLYTNKKYNNNKKNKYNEITNKQNINNNMINYKIQKQIIKCKIKANKKKWKVQFSEQKQTFIMSQITNNQIYMLSNSVSNKIKYQMQQTYHNHTENSQLFQQSNSRLNQTHHNHNHKHKHKHKHNKNNKTYQKIPIQQYSYCIDVFNQQQTINRQLVEVIINTQRYFKNIKKQQQNQKNSSGYRNMKKINDQIIQTEQILNSQDQQYLYQYKDLSSQLKLAYSLFCTELYLLLVYYTKSKQLNSKNLKKSSFLFFQEFRKFIKYKFNNIPDKLQGINTKIIKQLYEIIKQGKNQQEKKDKQQINKLLRKSKLKLLQTTQKINHQQKINNQKLLKSLNNGSTQNVLVKKHKQQIKTEQQQSKINQNVIINKQQNLSIVKNTVSCDIVSVKSKQQVKQILVKQNQKLKQKQKLKIKQLVQQIGKVILQFGWRVLQNQEKSQIIIEQNYNDSSWLINNLSFKIQRKQWQIFQYDYKHKISEKNKRYKMPIKHKPNLWVKDQAL